MEQQKNEQPGCSLIVAIIVLAIAVFAAIKAIQILSV